MRDVVVTGMGPVFLFEETRERWKRAEERETDTVGLFEGAGPCRPLTLSQQPVTAERVHEGMPCLALRYGVVIV